MKNLILIGTFLTITVGCATAIYGRDPCAGVKCRFGAKCVVRNGVAKCECDRACPKNYDPVCGTDGKTYANRCLLNVARCEKQKDIRVDHPGKCDPCAGVRCRFGAKCVVRNGAAKCECDRACPRHYDPVCGTDGKTYANRCLLNVARCEKQKDIQVDHTGRCDPCADIKCRFGAKCVVKNDEGKCECNTVCTEIFDPVCGTDGKTYSNECKLNVARCVNQKDIRVAKKGECEPADPCAGVRCPRGQNCVQQSGEATCKKRKPTCAAVTCIRGSRCVIRKGKAVCERVLDPYMSG